MGCCNILSKPKRDKAQLRAVSKSVYCQINVKLVSVTNLFTYGKDFFALNMQHKINFSPQLLVMGLDNLSLSVGV